MELRLYFMMRQKRDTQQDIFKLRDIDVNSASVKVLPVNKKFDMQLFEKKIIEKGKQLINSEQATKLYNLYYAEYEKQDFASKSVAFKINSLDKKSLLPLQYSSFSSSIYGNISSLHGSPTA